MVLELALDVSKKTGSANPEKLGLKPFPAQLFLHQDLVIENILGRGNTACRFIAYFESSVLLIIPDHARHRECHQ